MQNNNTSSLENLASHHSNQPPEEPDTPRSTSSHVNIIPEHCRALFDTIPRLTASPGQTHATAEFKYWLSCITDYCNEANITQPKDVGRLVKIRLSPVVYTLVETAKPCELIDRLKHLYGASTRNPMIELRRLLQVKRNHDGDMESFISSIENQWAKVRLPENILPNDVLKCLALILGCNDSEVTKQLLLKSEINFSKDAQLARISHAAQMDRSEILLPAQKHPLSRDLVTPPSKPSLSVKFCPKCGLKELYGPHKQQCPAKDIICHHCKKPGHLVRVCPDIVSPTSAAAMTHSRKTSNNTGEYDPQNSGLTLYDRYMPVILRDLSANFFCTITALFDTGSDDNYINAKLLPQNIKLGQCSKHYVSSIHGVTKPILTYCILDVAIGNKEFFHQKFYVLEKGSIDVVIGLETLKHAKFVSFTNLKNFKLSFACVDVQSAFPMLNLDPVDPFKHLSPNVQPIASKSRRYSPSDRSFIKSEISKLLSMDIIEYSSSPWRSQIVVANKITKPRLVIDYSETINKFTYTDAYPTPRIEELIQKVAFGNCFSVLDLKSAYYQIRLADSAKKYTAFEANGNLYQFKRLPMGLCNSTAIFQRIMDKLIKENDLPDTYAYLDDLTISSSSPESHAISIAKFKRMAKENNLTINEQKSHFNLSEIKLLGYEIKNHTLSPDKDRIAPLEKFKSPSTVKQKQRLLGVLAYYSKWLQNYSDRIQPLINAKLPWNDEAMYHFKSLIFELSSVTLQNIDFTKPFEVGTDASENCIGATLSQNDKPVAFFSKTLSPSEKKYPSLEKEGLAIISALEKWMHILASCPFSIYTDQRTLSFIFDKNKGSKIKVAKLERWRAFLSQFNYKIIYKPGPQNIVPDALSRISGAALNREYDDIIANLHASYAHPGQKRLFELVKSLKVPATLSDIRRVLNKCNICHRLKPRYAKSPGGNVIQSPRPMYRMSIDFKCPPVSSGPYKYLLIIVDEYSRFSWAIPCTNMRSETVIKALDRIFGEYGIPTYIHSDNAPNFSSNELKDYLLRHGVYQSHSSVYNPQGNSQCERYVGSIWQNISLILEERKLPLSKWHTVVNDALRASRWLINTTTNETPFERMFSRPTPKIFIPEFPQWLKSNSYALYRRNIRTKSDPKNDVVYIVEVKPNHAIVQFPDTSISVVPFKDLAPYYNEREDDTPNSDTDSRFSCDEYEFTHPHAEFLPPSYDYDDENEEYLESEFESSFPEQSPHLSPDKLNYQSASPLVQENDKQQLLSDLHTVGPDNKKIERSSTEKCASPTSKPSHITTSLTPKLPKFPIKPTKLNFDQVTPSTNIGATQQKLDNSRDHMPPATTTQTNEKQPTHSYNLRPREKAKASKIVY